jgi:predicted nucleic acid-binding Zn ribbon protein
MGMTNMATDKDNNQEELDERDLPDEVDVKDGEEDSGTYPCPYCGKEVYEDAVRCPNCQRYVSPKGDRPGIGKWIVILFLLIGAAAAVWALLR